MKNVHSVRSTHINRGIFSFIFSWSITINKFQKIHGEKRVPAPSMQHQMNFLANFILPSLRMMLRSTPFLSTQFPNGSIYFKCSKCVPVCECMCACACACTAWSANDCTIENHIIAITANDKWTEKSKSKKVLHFNALNLINCYIVDFNTIQRYCRGNADDDDDNMKYDTFDEFPRF